jgi:hypothetical protein
VDLGSGDDARLGSIEARLTETDPELAARFRQWTPDRRGPLPLGWSAVPAPLFAVFLVGFCTWVVSPALGALVVVVAVVCGVRAVVGRAHRRAAQDTGWWYRPTDRR